jgi:hypothetical protein
VDFLGIRTTLPPDQWELPSRREWLRQLHHRLVTPRHPSTLQRLEQVATR